MDLKYLSRRAQLDGLAWARREGGRADIAPLAYQWWRQWFAALGAPWADPGSAAAHWHYHRLTRRRHGCALSELTCLHLPAGGQVGTLWKAVHLAGGFVKLARDEAKTAVRHLLRPWYRSQPLRTATLAHERVAVVAFGFLGDLVLLQSVLRGLTDQYPRLGVYVVAPPAAQDVLRGVLRLNLTIPPTDLKAGSRRAVEWLGQWFDGVDPDVIVAPYLHGPWGRTLTAIRQPTRPIYGFDRDQGLMHRRQVERIGRRIDKDFSLHEVENLAALFGAAGLPCCPLPAQVALSPEALERLEQTPSFPCGDSGGPSSPSRWILFNPDAGYPQKEWTDAQWADLARRVLDRTTYRIVVNTVQPHPELEEALKADDDRVCWTSGVADLIAWMSRCAAVVTTDSGPQHLAHALGAPSLTLYGPTDERRWGDRWRRPIHRTLRACAADLTPEEKRGLAVNHEVSLISVDRTYNMLMALLSSERSEHVDRLS